MLRHLVVGNLDAGDVQLVVLRLRVAHLLSCLATPLSLLHLALAQNLPSQLRLRQRARELDGVPLSRVATILILARAVQQRIDVAWVQHAMQRVAQHRNHVLHVHADEPVFEGHVEEKRHQHEGDAVLEVGITKGRYRIAAQRHLTNEHRADGELVTVVVFKGRKRVVEEEEHCAELVTIVHLAEATGYQVKRSLVEIRKRFDEIAHLVELHEMKSVTLPWLACTVYQWYRRERPADSSST